MQKGVTFKTTTNGILPEWTFNPGYPTLRYKLRVYITIKFRYHDGIFSISFNACQLLRPQTSEIRA